MLHLTRGSPALPLYDHFHPPWSVQRPWAGFHGAWTAAIAFHLNSGLLPADSLALPLLEILGQVKGDVGTFHDGEPPAPDTPLTCMPSPTGAAANPARRGWKSGRRP